MCIRDRPRTECTIKDDIAWAYINARNLGLDKELSQQIFETVPTLTLDDIQAYQQANVKDRTYHIAILADLDDIDIDALRAMGKVVILTTEDIFGY